MAKNKIGFHASVGGNPTGIGEHLQRLNDAGIPFFIKSADGMTGVYDAQVIMRNSNIPHTAVWRRSVPYQGATPGYNPDVPDYSRTPKEAAQIHWDYHKQGIPPELDGNLVWVETINELRKEVEWADWLGHFATETAMLMNADGYKFAAFGYATGNPDMGAWETDGMLRYLRYCEQNPTKAAIALHEYSLDRNDIWAAKGYLIGRLEFLHDACDQHNIKRPNILITEWGWEYQNIAPTTAEALIDIMEVAEYYAQFPNVLGAGIWYLGPGYGGIATPTQKLISPLTDLTISVDFPDPEPEPDPIPQETLEAFLERVAEENRVINYNTLAALETKIVADGFVPYGKEKWETHETTEYAIQGARKLGTEEKRVYYATVGDWSNVKYIVQGVTVPAPPPLVIYDVVESLPTHPTLNYATREISDITTITIHHTVSVTTIENIASYHVNTRGWPGIAYHYVIEEDGKVSMVNYPTTISYHAGVIGEQNNEHSIGIAMIGNFTSNYPTPAQITSMKLLLASLELPRAVYTLPHRLMPGQTTVCPGAIWEDWFGEIAPVPPSQMVSLKFVPGDKASVTANSLNVRAGANTDSDVLGVVTKGETGTIQNTLPKASGSIDWWEIDFGHVKGWCAESYLTLDEVTTPPPPTVKRDLLPYLRGSGILYEVLNANGGQERFQTQVYGDEFWQTKNDGAECLRLENGYILRDWDTSPGGGRYYRQTDLNAPTGAGSKWVKQLMSVGESHTQTRYVQFYNWDCTESADNSGVVLDTMMFVAHYPSYTFRTGITLEDVVKLEWVNGAEIYFYARGFGLVAWERKHQDPNTPSWSAISEIHAPGQRPDNIPNLPNCLY